MKFKVGDPVEFDATVKGIFPQDDDLLVALLLDGGGRHSMHDRWLRRTETGPLSEGEAVTITGKVSKVWDDKVSSRLDGNGEIVTWPTEHMRRA